MKAYELPVTLSEDGKLDIPAGLAAELPRGETIRVIILVPEMTDSEENELWHNMVAEQFLAGYAESDSVYDTI